MIKRLCLFQIFILNTISTYFYNRNLTYSIIGTTLNLVFYVLTSVKITVHHNNYFQNGILVLAFSKKMLGATGALGRIE